MWKVRVVSANGQSVESGMEDKFRDDPKADAQRYVDLGYAKLIIDLPNLKVLWAQPSLGWARIYYKED